MTDCGFGGFFAIETARDVFGKMERDFARLKASPADSDAAFNFFVTAYHIIDWLARGDEGKLKVLRQGAIPRICKHLANGAKHLTLREPHDAIQHADAMPSPFASGRFASGRFAQGWLAVDLGPSERDELRVARIDAVTLAEKVIEHWRKRVLEPTKGEDLR